MTVLEYYERGGPESWCQGAQYDSDARCLMGAICFCHIERREVSKMTDKVKEVLRSRGWGGTCSILVWNDTAARTFNEVLALVREAGV